MCNDAARGIVAETASAVREVPVTATPVLRRITYSPKVFIPVTMLCRDRCGYCTFAQSPAHVPSAYLSVDEVLAIARAGAEAGCHEALFTLGEFPEHRYPVARQWLDERGYDSTIDYVLAAARLVLDETGLLPHVNAGALGRDDLLRLRAVSPTCTVPPLSIA